MSGLEPAIAAILADAWPGGCGVGIHAAFPADRFLPAPVDHWLYTGDGLLHLAAAAHRPGALRGLLAAGARVEACGSRRRARALHYAADGLVGGAGWDPSRQEEAIRLLLGAGAEVDPRDANGATPLLRAVRCRCSGAVAVLLAAGADPRAANAAGTSALRLAEIGTGRGGSGSAQARAHQAAILDLLRRHGAAAG